MKIKYFKNSGTFLCLQVWRYSIKKIMHKKELDSKIIFTFVK
jgi:hypothetical protein